MNHPAGSIPDSDPDLDPETAMDPDHDSPVREEPATVPVTIAPSSAPTPSPEAPPRPGLVATILAIVSKIPFPSLGSERHEMILDPVPVPGSSPGTDPAPPPSRPTPPTPRARRIPILSAFLDMRRETRVGVAALLSFVVLVGSLVVKKGWIGGKTPTVLAMPSREGDPDTTSTEKTEPKLETPATSQEPKKEAEPAPVVPPEVKPSPKVEPPGGDPAVLPPPLGEKTDHAPLGQTPTATPPALPMPSPMGEGSTPGQGDPPPAVPVTLPEVKPEATPSPLPGPDPIGMPEIPSPTHSPATAPNSKPKEPEVKPEPAKEASAPVDLPPMNPPVATRPAAPVLPVAPPVETTPAPQVQAPPAQPVETPMPTPTIEPVPAEKPPTLESVPAGNGGIESATTRASIAGMAGLAGGWVSIPSGGRRIIGAVPIVSTPAEATVDTPRIADGPKFTDDLTTVDQVEPVVHVVQSGENFFTIARDYYGSGRFYKALHAANKKQVPDIRLLYIGTVLRIPPPEALDRSLIDPTTRSIADDARTAPVSRTSSHNKRPELAGINNEDVDLAMPSRRRPAPADPEAAPPIRRPTYKVKDGETLRSIARDTLNDASRYKEIFSLNREALETLNAPLQTGTTLTLPADATSGRRTR